MNNSVIKYVLLGVIVVSLIGIYFSYETEIVEVDIEKELKSIATKPYIEEKIINAIKSENTDDLDMYLGLAEFLNIELSKNIKADVEKYNSTFNMALRNTKDSILCSKCTRL